MAPVGFAGHLKRLYAKQVGVYPHLRNYTLFDYSVQYIDLHRGRCYPAYAVGLHDRRALCKQTCP
jgi:hypothetical protein